MDDLFKGQGRGVSNTSARVRVRVTCLKTLDEGGGMSGEFKAKDEGKGVSNVFYDLGLQCQCG